jgi:hypothetical protein
LVNISSTALHAPVTSDVKGSESALRALTLTRRAEAVGTGIEISTGEVARFAGVAVYFLPQVAGSEIESTESELTQMSYEVIAEPLSAGLLNRTVIESRPSEDQLVRFCATMVGAAGSLATEAVAVATMLAKDSELASTNALTFITFLSSVILLKSYLLVVYQQQTCFKMLTDRAIPARPLGL